MSDVIGIVVFMAIVVGIAAAVLFVVDRLTLRGNLSAEERKKVVGRRTEKWRRAWGLFYMSMAAIALVVNGLNLSHESLRSRIGWSAAAAVVVIWFLLSTGDKDDEAR